MIEEIARTLSPQMIFASSVGSLLVGAAIGYPVQRFIAELRRRRVKDHSEAEEASVDARWGWIRAAPSRLKAMDMRDFFAKIGYLIYQASVAALATVTNAGAMAATGSKETRKIMREAALDVTGESRVATAMSPVRNREMRNNAGLIPRGNEPMHRPGGQR